MGTSSWIPPLPLRDWALFAWVHPPNPPPPPGMRAFWLSTPPGMSNFSLSTPSPCEQKDRNAENINFAWYFVCARYYVGNTAKISESTWCPIIRLYIYYIKKYSLNKSVVLHSHQIKITTDWLQIGFWLASDSKIGVNGTMLYQCNPTAFDQSEGTMKWVGSQSEASRLQI